MLFTKSPDLGVVAAGCEVEMDALMSANEIGPFPETDDDVAVFTARGPSLL